jgi:hypothetical protein
MSEIYMYLRPLQRISDLQARRLVTLLIGKTFAPIGQLVNMGPMSSIASENCHLHSQESNPAVWNNQFMNSALHLVLGDANHQ